MYDRLVGLVCVVDSKWAKDKAIVENWRRKYVELIEKSSWSDETLKQIGQDIERIYEAVSSGERVSKFNSSLRSRNDSDPRSSI